MFPIMDDGNVRAAFSLYKKYEVGHMGEPMVLTDGSPQPLEQAISETGFFIALHFDFDGLSRPNIN
jgi:hypothetical protein